MTELLGATDKLVLPVPLIDPVPEPLLIKVEQVDLKELLDPMLELVLVGVGVVVVLVVGQVPATADVIKPVRLVKIAVEVARLVVVEVVNAGVGSGH